VAGGTHVLRSVATANDGGTGQAEITVTVETAVACSPSNPCGYGYDCVDGFCQPHTPPGGCSTERPCYAGFHCVDSVCVPNDPPPPGTTGAPCTYNADCNSGMCVDGASGHGYCTGECARDEDCPNQAACLDMGGMFLCGPPYSATISVGSGRVLVGSCALHQGEPAGLGALVVLGAWMARRRRRPPRRQAELHPEP